MNEWLGLAQVKAEVAARHPIRRSWPTPRRDSSLEVIRRTMRRNSDAELHPGRRAC